MVEVVLGRGKPQGTWLHEDLALEFASWLNPRFKLWCDQRIKEILNQGFSALTPEGTEYIKDQVGEAFSPLLTLFDFSNLSNQNSSLLSRG